MEIENVRECGEGAMADFFYGKGFVDGGVSHSLSTREDWQGNSEMTKLQETIIGRIINFDKEKD